MTGPRWRAGATCSLSPSRAEARQTCTALVPTAKEERGELHTAQRASKATLNSFSLLVLFFVGWVFFSSFK